MSNSMDLGRDLDASIAQIVFGWRIRWMDMGDRYELCRDLDGDPCAPVPRFHEDVAEAWKVLEIMSTRAFEQFQRIAVERGLFYCRFDKAATIICQAAVAACEEVKADG